MPRLVVFQRPPNADATNQTLGFFGSISTSWIRPVASAGPRLLNSIPFKVCESSPPPSCPDIETVAAMVTAADTTSILFMESAPKLLRGASPLGLPDTLSRERLRRLAPFAWLASLRSLASSLAEPWRRRALVGLVVRGFEISYRESAIIVVSAAASRSAPAHPAPASRRTTQHARHVTDGSLYRARPRHIS